MTLNGKQSSDPGKRSQSASLTLGTRANLWHAISRFVETETDFFLMLAEQNGYIVPKRCFPTMEAAAIFANQVRLHLEKHAPAALATK